MDKFLTLNQVLEVLSISRTNLYSLIERGEFLPPGKLGSKNVWPQSEVQDWMLKRVGTKEARLKAIPQSWRRIASALATGTYNAKQAQLYGDTEGFWHVVTAALERRFGLVVRPVGDGTYSLSEEDRAKLQGILGAAGPGWDTRSAAQ